MQQACARQNSRALPFSHTFLREAEHLWQAERSCYSHTTLSAMTMLSLAAAGLGRDQISLALLANAHEMAKEMELLATSQSISIVAELGSVPPATTAARSHATWGLYNYLR
jgi:hypothetical protein